MDRTYQLNIGGNTDFLNMLNRERLKSKKISKTEAVQSSLDTPLCDDDIHIGPSDYVPWQKDNKVCFLRMEGRIFGDTPINLELRLSVEDSPNSGGSSIDAIRICKLAKDRKIGGPLLGISAYTMKHPPVQYPDELAKEMVEQFIRGEVSEQEIARPKQRQAATAR
jgi:myo-inositol-1-phosphate synthase